MAIGINSCIADSEVAEASIIPSASPCLLCGQKKAQFDMEDISASASAELLRRSGASRKDIGVRKRDGHHEHSHYMQTELP